MKKSRQTNFIHCQRILCGVVWGCKLFKSSTKKGLPVLTCYLFFSSRDFLWLSWFVHGSDDIADFYISVKNRDNSRTVQEYHLHYNKRVFNISANALQNHDNLEICLFAKDSRGTIKKYFKSQCFNLNSDWKNINRKCKSNLKKYCDIYDQKTNQFAEMVTNGGAKLYTNFVQNNFITGIFIIFSLKLFNF